MARYDIADMDRMVSHLGGRCLSKEYIDKRTPLTWMCAKGHTWDSPYYNIQRGLWCRQCNLRLEKEERLEEIKALARSKGGECLSDTYENNHTHLLFRCAKGHEWPAKSNNIKTGHWCPTCAGKFTHTLKVFQRVAEKRGGKCLSPIYKHIDSKLRWRCSKGHEWEASGYSVKNRGSWCPVCAHRVPLTVADMQRHAESKGGKFLSECYDWKRKMKWQCAKGHVWMATSDKVYGRGHWCHVCSGYRKESNAS